MDFCTCISHFFPPSCTNRKLVWARGLAEPTNSGTAPTVRLGAEADFSTDRSCVRTLQGKPVAPSQLTGALAFMTENAPSQTISIGDIEAAERVLGIRYTKDERALMLDNIEGQIGLAQKRRQVQLPNSAPTASRFNPRLPGHEMPADQGAPRFLVPDPTNVPDNDENIAFAPVSQLGAWIASGALTSRRLTEIYLARIETLNPRLFCFAVVTPERARREADAADALLDAGTYLGPLHGIPYALKDLFDTENITTGWGAEPFRNRVPTEDATIVKKLRAAGAVLLGKSSVGALAYNDIWYGGRTRNPWNLNEGASGSSAGSASATAAGLCGFSIGTETLGSITSPSERCGTTGLRPTFGRVSRAGGMALSWSLDKVGPICRAAEDTAMVLSAINGADRADPDSIAAPFNFDASQPIDELRVGYLPDAFGEGATQIHRNALNQVKELGLEPVEVSLPDLPYGALMNVLYADAAAAFEELTLTDQDDTLTWQDAAAWPNVFRKARFLSAVDHVQLDRLRYQVMLALDDLFADIDVLIGPFLTGPMLVASNFTGHPCLHLRAGFFETPTRSAGGLGAGKLDMPTPPPSEKSFRVPQGISLWAPLFGEGPMIALGMALEKKLDVASARPGFAE